MGPGPQGWVDGHLQGHSMSALPFPDFCLFYDMLDVSVPEWSAWGHIGVNLRLVGAGAYALDIMSGKANHPRTCEIILVLPSVTGIDRRGNIFSLGRRYGIGVSLNMRPTK